MSHIKLFIFLLGLSDKILSQIDNKLYGQNYNSQDSHYDQNNYLSADKYNYRNSNINSNYNLNDFGNDYRYNQNSGQLNQFNIDYRGSGILNIDDYIEKDSDVDQNSNGSCPKFWVSFNPDSGSDYNRGGIYNDICFRFFISLKTRNEAYKVCQV